MKWNGLMSIMKNYNVEGMYKQPYRQHGLLWEAIETASICEEMVELENQLRTTALAERMLNDIGVKDQMIVIGYKPNANFVEAQNVLKKHTAFNISDIKQLLEHIREGQGVNLPDDFVLREDLEDLNFLLD